MSGKVSVDERRRLVAESLRVGNPGNNARDLAGQVDPRAESQIELAVDEIQPYQSFQGVGIFVVGAGKRRKQGGPKRTDFLPAVIVADGVLQDALEQHRQLRGRLGAIFFRQLEHRILHDVQRCLVVAHREQCLLVGAPLYAGEKIR